MHGFETFFKQKIVSQIVSWLFCNPNGGTLLNLFVESLIFSMSFNFFHFFTFLLKFSEGVVLTKINFFLKENHTSKLFFFSRWRLDTVGFFFTLYSSLWGRVDIQVGKTSFISQKLWLKTQRPNFKLIFFSPFLNIILGAVACMIRLPEQQSPLLSTSYRMAPFLALAISL